MILKTNGGVRLDVNQMEGDTLDYYVALSLEFKTFISNTMRSCLVLVSKPHRNQWTKFNPSTKWVHGGPLIQIHKISIEYHGTHDNMPVYAAYYGQEPAASNDTTCYGPDPLIAAMRTIVKEYLGETIDPEEYPTLEE
jgi:hypothetical protein